MSLKNQACRGACVASVAASEQVACQGACVAEHWTVLPDLMHKAPRWLARKQKRRHKSAAGGGGGGGPPLGPPTGFVPTWTEGLQLQAEYNASLSLRDACAVFFTDDKSKFRTQFISRRGDTALLLSFDEYKISSVRATTVRPERPDDAPLLQRCERRQLGIGLPFSVNNIWHQAFHAVPAWEALHAAVASHAAAAHRLDYESPTYIPLVLPRAGLGRFHSDDPATWHAWEFSVRPFSPLPAATLARQTAALLAAPCVCFDRVEAAAGLPFNPLALASATRLRAFTRVAVGMAAAAAAATAAAAEAAGRRNGLLQLGSLRFGGGRAALTAAAASSTATAMATRILFAQRGGGAPRIEQGKTIYGGRHVVNGEAVAAGLAPLRGRLDSLVLEEMPVVQQMLYLSSSAALLAVHGQALAWLIFLPHGAQRTALVEILPRGASAPIYQQQARTLGVRYEKVRATIADSCPYGRSLRGRGWLDCNLTVPSSGLLAAANRAVQWVDHGS